LDEGGIGFVLELWLVCVHESVVVYMHVLSAWVLLFCLCSLAFPYVLASVYVFACAPLLLFLLVPLAFLMVAPAFAFACLILLSLMPACFCFCL
jgi:hypothetical protein